MNAADQPDLVKPQMQPHPDVIAQRIGEEVALLHLKTNRFYELNRTAARLWELLGTGYDLANIHAQLLLEFDVHPAQLTSDLESILASLRAENLVQVHEGS
jgi:coenzyme PQQ synthesis protein D (PqqD)